MPVANGRFKPGSEEKKSCVAKAKGKNHDGRRRKSMRASIPWPTAS